MYDQTPHDKRREKQLAKLPKKQRDGLLLALACRECEGNTWGCYYCIERLFISRGKAGTARIKTTGGTVIDIFTDGTSEEVG